MAEVTTNPGLFAEDTICTELRATTKDEAIKEMIDLLYDAGVVTDKAVFTKVIMTGRRFPPPAWGWGLPFPTGAARL